MYVGIACTGHHNAIALLDSSGRLLFAQSAERDYQTKVAFNMAADEPVRMRQLLARYAAPHEEIIVCKSWSQDMATRMQREIERLGREVNKDNSLLEYAAKNWRRRLTESLTEIFQPNNAMAGSGTRQAAEELQMPVSIRTFDHHLTHAAYACHTSGFSTAACLVMDGFSEDVSQSLFLYEGGQLHGLPFADYDGALNSLAASLGIYYGYTVCALCGFSTFSGEEWKIMGLAPYGHVDQDILRLFRRLICVQNGRVIMPLSTAEAVLELFERRCTYAEDPQRCAVLAHTAQSYFSEMLFDVLAYVHEITHADNLVLTGGCALNSSFNGRILCNTAFRDLYVPPGPGDEGNAIGAALLAAQQDGMTQSKVAFSPYLGDAIDERTVEEFLARSRYPCVVKLDFPQLYAEVARELSDGKIVAWCQGRAEFGPRALGNRSILADPRNADMKNRINSAVKFREPFRPFAPCILHEYGAEYFLDYHFTPFMEKTLLFRPEVRQRLGAVCHADNTGRLQSVTRDSNTHLYELLRAFHAVTDVPVLLNTSFNVMGKPIVSTFNDAMITFLSTGVDLLVVGQFLFRKPAVH